MPSNKVPNMDYSSNTDSNSTLQKDESNQTNSKEKKLELQ